MGVMCQTKNRLVMNFHGMHDLPTVSVETNERAVICGSVNECAFWGECHRRKIRAGLIA